MVMWPSAFKLRGMSPTHSSFTRDGHTICFLCRRSKNWNVPRFESWTLRLGIVYDTTTRNCNPQCPYSLDQRSCYCPSLPRYVGIRLAQVSNMDFLWKKYLYKTHLSVAWSISNAQDAAGWKRHSQSTTQARYIPLDTLALDRARGSSRHCVMHTRSIQQLNWHPI